MILDGKLVSQEIKMGLIAEVQKNIIRLTENTFVDV